MWRLPIASGLLNLVHGKQNLSEAPCAKELIGGSSMSVGNGLALDSLASAFLGAVVSAAQADGGLVASRRGVVLARTAHPGVDLPLRLPQGLISRVLPGRTVVEADLSSSPLAAEPELNGRRVSVLCTAVTWGGRVQALLYLERSAQRPFQQAEVEALLDGAARSVVSWPTEENLYTDELPPLFILLVEDNEVNRKVALAFLERAGHSVAVAVDGFEAVTAVEQGDFDVVLMDIRMPGMDGVEATRRIRSMDDPRKSRMPIIALTANFSPPEVERYMAVGMNAVLRKPLRKGSIEEVLGPLFAVAEPAEADGGDDGLPLLDGERMTLLADAMDKDVLMELIGAARSSIQDTWKELDHAWNNADSVTVGRCAHRIAGVAANFGGAALAEISREIESDCRAGGNGQIFRPRFEEIVGGTLGALADQC